MAASGTEVKELATMPELLEAELFFYEMYQVCGANFSNVRHYCELHELGTDEILEAFKTISLIASGVENASNTTRT